MLHHIAIAKKYGVPVVVAVNRFFTDTDAELELVRKMAIEEGGAYDAVVSNHWEEGGAGALDLAKAVVKAAERPADFDFLYPLDWPIKKKIETIAVEIYGADGWITVPMRKNTSRNIPAWDWTSCRFAWPRPI